MGVGVVRRSSIFTSPVTPDNPGGSFGDMIQEAGNTPIAGDNHALAGHAGRCKVREA
jgi:hypothetical protein